MFQCRMMSKFSTTLTLVFLVSILPLVFANGSLNHDTLLAQESLEEGAKVSMPQYVRNYWMREANRALFDLQGPCPFAAFGSVIVNHTAPGKHGLGELVCIGANNITSGNPTLHGEIAAINNCSDLLTDPNGKYKLSQRQALNAFRELSIYTNGESCPMCASAIRWSGFKEYIYGTTIKTLIDKGWEQISIYSADLFEEARNLPGTTVIVPDVLTDETDPLFSWQYDRSYRCPEGCERPRGEESCVAFRKD